MEEKVSIYLKLVDTFTVSEAVFAILMLIEVFSILILIIFTIFIGKLIYLSMLISLGLWLYR